MKILGIEWSSERRSIAIGERSGEGDVRLLESIELPSGRSTRYFDAFESLVRKGCVKKSEITAVAVGLGPGSYAGIRSAIAVAYGWQLANQARLIGLPSARVLAAQAFETSDLPVVHTLIDAQRGECYHGIFRRDADGAIIEEKPMEIISPDTLATDTRHAEVFAGPDIERWFTGNASGDTRHLNLFPDAGALVVEAAGFLASEEVVPLEPIYLRPNTYVKAPPPHLPPGLDLNPPLSPSES